jgi:hypothetical protein
MDVVAACILDSSRGDRELVCWKQVRMKGKIRNPNISAVVSHISLSCIISLPVYSGTSSPKHLSKSPEMERSLRNATPTHCHGHHSSRDDTIEVPTIIEAGGGGTPSSHVPYRVLLNQDQVAKTPARTSSSTLLRLQLSLNLPQLTSPSLPSAEQPSQSPKSPRLHVP